MGRNRRQASTNLPLSSPPYFLPWPAYLSGEKTGSLKQTLLGKGGDSRHEEEVKGSG